MGRERRPGTARTASVLRFGGAGLLAAAGAIHLDLYITGYGSIPTIAPLFLLQVIAAFGLTAIILVTRSRLASAAGALLALSALGGYLVALRVGLFGFHEIRTAAGIAAGCVEVAAFATLAWLAVASGGRSGVARRAARVDALFDRLLTGVPGLRRVAACVTILAALLLGISVAAARTTDTSANGTVLKTGTVGAVTVLTDAQGYTLYWFGRDTSSASNCNDTCAQYWPPVIGASTSSAGVSGTLGTILRPDGSTQTTFDGHPLYTYAGDSGPGQDTGNGITLYGGVWHQIDTPGSP